MDLSIRSLSKLTIINQDQRIWTRWNRSWGRCWSRLHNQRFYGFQYWCYEGELFCRLILCKWMASSTNFMWVICQWKPSLMSIGCVMSLKWSQIISNVVILAFHYRIPTIQVGRHLNHLPPPNLLSLCMKMKCAIARWIALLITEDGGCGLIFCKGD